MDVATRHYNTDTRRGMAVTMVHHGARATRGLLSKEEREEDDIGKELRTGRRRSMNTEGSLINPAVASSATIASKIYKC